MKSKFSLLIITVFLIFSCDSKSKTENENAKLKNSKERSITIINNTSEKLIKECDLKTPEGIMVDHKVEQKEFNFSFKDFDKKFDNLKNLKITMTDRFGIKYEKEFSLNNEGNTEVVFDESDCVSGNPIQRLFRWVNKSVNKKKNNNE